MRRAVGLLAVCLLATGCIGSPGTATVDQSPTSTPDARSATPSTTEPTASRDVTITRTPACVEERPETVHPARESVTPSPLPERPDDLTAESAGAFATAYEKAYRRNQGLEANTETYEVYVEESAVVEIETGYLVTMTAGYWYNEGGVPEGNVTQTIVHADGPRYEVGYLVTGDRLRRDSGLEDGVVEPRSGAILECWS